ncbi:hypothetical protein IOLA_055 [uncultured bacterium]|nr:hypothetical protein IOLA_055 [uncultured bacterium]
MIFILPVVNESINPSINSIDVLNFRKNEIIKLNTNNFKLKRRDQKYKKKINKLTNNKISSNHKNIFIQKSKKHINYINKQDIDYHKLDKFIKKKVIFKNKKPTKNLIYIEEIIKKIRESKNLIWVDISYNYNILSFFYQIISKIIETINLNINSFLNFFISY